MSTSWGWGLTASAVYLLAFSIRSDVTDYTLAEYARKLEGNVTCTMFIMSTYTAKLLSRTTGTLFFTWKQADKESTLEHDIWLRGGKNLRKVWEPEDSNWQPSRVLTNFLVLSRPGICLPKQEIHVRQWNLCVISSVPLPLPKLHTCQIILWFTSG